MKVKLTVKSLEDDKAVLIIDDTIQEKTWTDENELMCLYFDHCTGRNVRWINLLNALYDSNGMSIPVAFKLVKKPHQYLDIKTQKLKPKSKFTKNALMRSMFENTIKNGLKFRFVLMDSWFSSAETFKFIISKNRHFITGFKSNILVALTEEDRQKNRFIRVNELNFPEEKAMLGWLKRYDKQVLLVPQIFTNKDRSTGILYLVCSDLTCDYDTITTTYKKRCHVEIFHKSLK